jgi:hypothetical protein
MKTSWLFRSRFIWILYTRSLRLLAVWVGLGHCNIPLEEGAALTAS